MAVYPTTLPAPLRRITGSTGSAARRRQCVSGREETRVWGVQVDAVFQGIFRLRRAEVADWIAFYEQDANMGVNWVSAYWLPCMGYADHMFRFVGYPRRAGGEVGMADFSVGIAVRESSLCWPDTAWPMMGE